jgi:hypothetical protein
MHMAMAHKGGRDPLEMTLKAFTKRYSAEQAEQTTMKGKEGEGQKKKKKL